MYYFLILTLFSHIEACEWETKMDLQSADNIRSPARRMTFLKGPISSDSHRLSQFHGQATYFYSVNQIYLSFQSYILAILCFCHYHETKIRYTYLPCYKIHFCSHTIHLGWYNFVFRCNHSEHNLPYLFAQSSFQTVRICNQTQK